MASPIVVAIATLHNVTLPLEGGVCEECGQRCAGEMTGVRVSTPGGQDLRYHLACGDLCALSLAQKGARDVPQ